MLRKLLIKNIALIDCAEINFTQGLNVLSGETGAGKSVIIESLNFVLGAKADKTLIRTGATECQVRAEFNILGNNSVSKVFEEFDIDYDEQLIISRKFSSDGKTSIKINGNTVTLGMLKKFTSKLVDVHGQSEHFHLLKNSNQLELIDRFGGEEVVEVKSALKEEFHIYKELLSSFNELGGSESDRLVKIDILNYQINEIEKIDLKENEEEELQSLREKIKHQEKIVSALSSLKGSITEEGGVSDILSNVSRLICSISEFDKQYSELNDRLSNAFSEIDDIASCADNLLDSIDTNDISADEIEDRITAIKNLKKKYGTSYEEITKFLDNAKAEKEKLENFNDTAAKLENDIIKSKKKIYALYCDLHNLRVKYSDVFAKNVVSELSGLGMARAKFSVYISEIRKFDECKFESSNGFDDVEFMFSANLGEPLKSLSAVISGGEMSRFMLAIKTQSAKYNDISTFMFDEIDAGISGNVAKIVAEKFAIIAKDVQIIAITHLPQISAMADNNLLIVKTDDGVATHTNVFELDKESKVQEIMRLVGGGSDSEIAKKHAEELINSAIEYKKKIL